jgi:bacterioferritin-associated ferredoxin
MFVCICNGITERQIRAAIEDGACSVHELAARLGVASGCGCCAEFAASLISESSAGEAGHPAASVPA